MRFTDLIIEASLDAFDRGAELGVRLSPLKLSAGEVNALVKAATAQRHRGYELYVAVASSDAVERDEERLCVAPGDRAPERATEWRNSINAQAGQRVLYVAPRRLGKAGGLEDTLLPIGEEDLRATCYSWMSQEGSGGALIPSGFSQALEGAALERVISARALTSFIDHLALESGDKGVTWSQLGERLPLLNLCQDSKLTEEDALIRLTANLSVVERAFKNEQRRDSGSLPAIKELSDELSARLRVSASQEEALIAVDLGGVETRSITPKKKRKVSRVEQTQKVTNKTRERTSKEQAKIKDPEPKAVTLEERLLATLTKEDAAEEVSSPPVISTGPEISAMKDEAQVVPQPELKSGSHQPSDKRGGDSETLIEVLSEAQTLLDVSWWARRAAKDKLSVARGMSASMRALCRRMCSLEANWGWTIVVKAPHLRQCLARLPAVQSDEPQLPPKVTNELSEHLKQWDERRAELIKALNEVGGEELMAELSGDPLSMLIEDEVLSSTLERLLETSAEALCIAAKCGEPLVMRSTLNRDTLTLISQSSGERLTLLSPLHPLTLGQTLTRLKQHKAAKGSSRLVKELLVKSLLEAPIAPQRWLDKAGELCLAPAEGGLVVYESDPNKLLDEDLTVISRSLTLKYLDLHPFTTLGLSVLIQGTPLSAVVDGIAEAVVSYVERDQAQLAPVEVILSSHVTGALKQRTLSVIADGLLRLSPRLSGRHQRPHLIITLVDNEPTALSLEAEGSPQLSHRYAVGAGAQTTFKIEQRGLHTLSPVKGVRGCEEVEALLSALDGRTPRGYLINLERAVKLTAAFPEAAHDRNCWQAMIGVKLSKVPRRGAHLLLHERGGPSAEVAVMCQSTRSTTRSLTPIIKRLGGVDQRAKVVERFTERLSALGGQGVMSLQRSSSQLISAAALSLLSATERAGSPGVFGLLEGPHLSRLLGYKDKELPGAFAVSVWITGGRLRFLISYASVEGQLPYKINAGRLEGELIDAIKTLSQIIKLSTSVGDELQFTVPREALRWLLMPPLAEAVLSGDSTLGGLKAALEHLGEEELSVELSAACVISEVEVEDIYDLKGLKVSMTPFDITTLERLMSSSAVF